MTASISSEPYGTFQGGPQASVSNGAPDLGLWDLDGARSSHGFLQRRPLNAVAIVLNTLIPWAIFLLACWSLAFRFRYEYPWFAWTLYTLCVLAVAILGYMAIDAEKDRREKGLHTMSWKTFCFLTSFFMLLLASGLGNYIYFRHCLSSFQRSGLKTFMNVDVSRMPSSTMLDAGRAEFSRGTSLDLSKLVVFRQEHNYCAAPLVMEQRAMRGYDFWLVGKDCCSKPDSRNDSRKYRYSCGLWEKMRGHYLYRLMNDHDQKFYRLAVQKAEAAFNINATHPLFFVWPSKTPSLSLTQGNASRSTVHAGDSTGAGMGTDAEVRAGAGEKRGWFWFKFTAIGSLVLQLVMVVMAAVGFADIQLKLNVR